MLYNQYHLTKMLSFITREYNRDSDAPIIFTKSAPASQYRQTTTLVETEENLTSDFPLDRPQRLVIQCHVVIHSCVEVSGDLFQI